MLFDLVAKELCTHCVKEQIRLSLMFQFGKINTILLI
jgi:hypothetical protein